MAMALLRVTGSGVGLIFMPSGIAISVEVLLEQLMPRLYF